MRLTVVLSAALSGMVVQTLAAELPTVRFKDWDSDIERLVSSSVGGTGSSYNLVTNCAGATTWGDGYYVVGRDYDGNGAINGDDATYGKEHELPVTFGIGDTLTITGNVTLILVDGFTLNICGQWGADGVGEACDGDGGHCGVSVSGTGALTISGQSAGGAMGCFNIYGGGGGNPTPFDSYVEWDEGGSWGGWGGYGIYNIGPLVMNGGKVVVAGGDAGDGSWASGVGGDGLMAAGEVTIRGGCVTFEPGNKTAGHCIWIGGTGAGVYLYNSMSIIGGDVTVFGYGGSDYYQNYGGERWNAFGRSVYCQTSILVDENMTVYGYGEIVNDGNDPLSSHS